MNWRIFFLLSIFLVLNIWLGDRTEPRRPLPEVPSVTPDYGDLGKPLPNSSGKDTEIIVGLGPKTDSTGTAFALREQGWWMTARHVVDLCSQIQLRFPAHRAMMVSRRALHPDADLAVLYTGGSTVPLALSGKRMHVGQNGYQIGYPSGVPGEVWSTLLGRRRMRVSGRYRTNEPILAWAERSRRPSYLKSLGGLSGGPALDGGGEVVGVLVAESRRRGRVYTAAPMSMKQLLPMESPHHEALTAMALNPSSLDRQAQRLRQAPSVAKVICIV